MSKAPRDAKKSTNVDSPVSDAHAGFSQTPAPRDTGVAIIGPSRIVGSQAKKQEEVTRQGTQKMKFIPTLPVRRKLPDTEVKEEAPAPSIPTKPTERGRGRGRGLGRGRGRGQPPPRPEMQMTASGPFAMGPALAGTSKRRVPPSNFTPVMAMGAGSTSLGGGLSGSGAPVLSRGGAMANKSVVNADEDLEVYSDPDEGVQIVDMDAIKTMDWMAPESLRRERGEAKGSKKKKNAEAVKRDFKGKEKATDDTDDETIESFPVAEVEKNLANALDLSDNEEEEEMEDLIEDFASKMQSMEEDDSLARQEKLYFFQFPQPFPTFSLPDKDGVSDSTVPKGHQPEIEGQTNAFDKGKKVAFAQDVKPPASNGSQGSEGPQDGISVETGATVTNTSEEKKLDGVVGQLEVHRSGIIKMRLGNGTLMDVTAATQPSFLQHAIFLDPAAKKMHVLGEVNRRFVVSPDVDKLLEEMDMAEAATKVKSETAADAS